MLPGLRLDRACQDQWRGSIKHLRPNRASDALALIRGAHANDGPCAARARDLAFKRAPHGFAQHRSTATLLRRLWLATMAVALIGPATASAQDRLPDLAMATLKDFTIERTATGRKLLRYTATVVNVGAGRFQVEGSRASTAESEMSVVQRISNDAGGSSRRPTDARMYFAGDGHNHWHVRDLEQSSLDRLDNGVKVGSGAKHGFCFFDNVAFRLSLAGAPPNPFYTTCGTTGTVLSQTMGLSTGWGDAYYYYLVDQWVDITTVGPGRYRLSTTADPQNWFLESSEANNATWAELQLKKSGSPRVVRYGPPA